LVREHREAFQQAKVAKEPSRSSAGGGGPSAVAERSIPRATAELLIDAEEGPPNLRALLVGMLRKASR